MEDFLLYIDDIDKYRPSPICDSNISDDFAMFSQADPTLTQHRSIRSGRCWCNVVGDLFLSL